jgi:dGTPase
VRRELANRGEPRSEPDRRQEEKLPNDPVRNYRSPAQRDRDRILYCSAFHRLAHVTQVTASEAGHTFHNRLGHSLKVAQVGRRNAERLEKLARDGELDEKAAALVASIDPDAVEASCLAHDLGHPPFGHIAERALHKEAQERLGLAFDAFEGNAQSFRIVSRLAIRADAPGLTLTRQTLDGLLKYPWGYSSDEDSPAHHKWGFYGGRPESEAGDAEAFRHARPGAGPEPGPEEKRCLEAEIMDWADDLTYAVHDLDDFFRAGLIPLHRLADKNSPESDGLAGLFEDAKEAEPAAFPKHPIDELVGATHRALALPAPGPRTAYEYTVGNRAQMREFGSKLITRYLKAFRLVSGAGGVELEIDDEARCEVEALKLLVRVYVVRRPGLAVVQHGQERMIRELFCRYFDASGTGENGDRRIFPPGARERLEKTDDSDEERARVAIDLIAGLTEAGAVQLHQRLEGGWTSVRALDATAGAG